MIIACLELILISHWTLPSFTAILLGGEGGYGLAQGIMPAERLLPSSSSKANAGQGDDADNHKDDDNDDDGRHERQVWGPYQETRYWMTTRSLGLTLIVASAGLVQALLSVEAIFFLVLTLASFSSLIATVYHRVRENGLLHYMPESTRLALQETTLLDWLLDTSLADRLKPYAVLSMGLNEEERAFLINSMSTQEQSVLMSPGLIHALPQVRRLM